MNTAPECPALRQDYALDGEWTLVLDPEDRGLRESWQNGPDQPESITVTVASVWDRWVPDYDGVGWYFRTFDRPEGWDGQHVDLHFEAADYYAEVWLNGVRLGDHEGGYTPFSFNATAHLRQEKNRLAVRIVDPHAPEGRGDFRPKEIPCAKENGYWSFAGIWGAVYLEAKPKAHIEDVFVQPDLRRKRLAISVAASGDAGTVHLQIEGTHHHTEGPPGDFVLDFPEFDLWSTEEPVLYHLRVDYIQDDGVHDQVRVRFGMREFTVKDNRFYLNGRPIFVKAALFQPDYPRSLAAPESPELARRELELAKEAGFNMLRMHLKPPPPITLELADELGILVYEEPPIGWIKGSTHLERRCTNEVREMILRDRNHPSVVVWGMLNESGSAGCTTGDGAQTIKDKLCAVARELDPSRLVIDDSGGVNATRESARMMRPYRDTFEAYDDLHVYLRAPVDSDIARYYRHNGAPDRLVHFGEFGFGGPEDLEDVIAQYGEDKDTLKDARALAEMLDAAKRGFEERGLDRVFGTFAKLLAAGRRLQCDAARLQIDAIRANPKAGGYCYTQLADAGHEFCAGALDRWRRPKPVFETLKQVQQPVRPLIQMAKTNLKPRETVSVTVLLANESRLEGRADLSLQVVGPTNQVLWKKKRGVKLPRHGKEIWSGDIGASGSTGTHKFVVRVIQKYKRLTEAEIAFYVHEPAAPCGVKINLLDPDGRWSPRCQELAILSNLLAPVHVIPPLGNTIGAYPYNDLMQVFAQVHGGAVALFFSPPDDWNDLAEHLGPGLEATPKDAVGGFLMACHYVKLHPVFEKLPARGLMRQPYRNVVPAKTFIEMSDEDICGTFDTAPVAAGHYMIEETPWWGSDILVRRYGAGRVLFTHLRVLEHLGEDPVADRLFVNLLSHFARRSVPSDAPLKVEPKAVEWLRGIHSEKTRKWMVIGEFPNFNGEGHQSVYPPEENIDLDATYPGWYKAITWQPFFSRAENGHRIDLQEAFSPIFEYYPRFDYATGYAYAEFICDRRQDVFIDLGGQNPTKLWLNGTMLLETEQYTPHDQWEDESLRTFVKQGRNTILVKCSKIPGPFRLSIDFRPTGKETLSFRWWK